MENKMSEKRVWIELDKADNLEDAKEYCELANKMLAKLGVDKNYNFWATDKQKYTRTFYNFSEGHSFTELDDRGKWFDLEYCSNNET
jgi:hypothetical protein